MRERLALGSILLLACTEAPRMQPAQPVPDGLDMAAPAGADLTGVVNPNIDLAEAAPVIAGFSPAKVKAGTELTINGSFHPQATVLLNNMPATKTGASATQIKVIVPALTKFGPVPLRVINPSGASVITGNNMGPSYSATQLSFQPITTSSVYNRTRAFALGDYNKDGNLDIVVPAFDQGNYSILTGTGNGNFIPLQPTYTFGTIGGQATWKSISRDINKDGRMDVLFGTNSSQIHYYLGNDSGRVDQINSVNYGCQSTVFAMDTADFNNDGFEDVIGVYRNSQYSIFYNTQNNANLFSGGQANITSLPANPTWVDTVDVDKDGKKDAIIVYDNNAATTFSVLIATGAQANPFNAIQNFAINNTNQAPQNGAPGDFNNDGKIDYIVGDVNTNQIRLFKGNGTAANSFDQTPVTLSVGIDPRQVNVGDFNGDGNLDIVVANRSSHTIGVLLGNGDYTFAPQIEFTAGYFPWRVEAADLNKDGRADIVVGLEQNSIGSAAPGLIMSFVNISQ